ncbi:hypothetical protein BVX97_04725 [bacterium E08(2017)]|nr:hypothetical protein BVX97_04725 [bacterium E08(2017)]
MVMSALLYSPAQDEDSQLASLHIKANPSGASITFDGRGPYPAPYLASGIEPGDHLIVITKDGYKTHRQTITLSAGQRVPLEINLAPLTGLLLVHTEPEGMNVTLDDADQGVTPLLLTSIELGKYKVKLSKPGYISKTLDVNIDSRMPKRIRENLIPNSATLVLDSSPSGAKITLNGVSHGVTPKIIREIPGGASTLELEYDGYELYKKPLQLAAGQKASVVAELKAIPSKLTVVSIPPKARVYINNQFKGEAPVTIEDMEPGSIRVRGELPGYETTARTIELGRASDVTEELRLDGNCGQIQIITQPAGITVFVDGHEKGVTSFKDDETDRISNPLTIELIPEGERVIKLVGKQHFPASFKVMVERGKTTTISPKKLRRRFIPDIEIRTATGVYQGVLVMQSPDGSIKIETKPGIFKVIEGKDIKVKRPLRAPSLKEDKPSN